MRVAAGIGDAGVRGIENGPPKNAEEYLAGVPEPARTTLTKVREVIRSVVPAATSEVISYGIPAFKYKGLLVGIAAFPKHCGFYPMSPSVMETFRNELAEYETSKGTIRFAPDKPLPTALVKKLVKARIVENERKADAKSGVDVGRGSTGK
ncbi:MAG TPA: DUF1801 domain-containing protein [Bryobacteraceae bacterium]|nr:DUF1801 domain-containing protein [Bryobacteraceae bacterium]